MSSLITTVGPSLASKFFGKLIHPDDFGSLPSERQIDKYAYSHLLVAFPATSVSLLVEKAPDRFYYTWNEAWYRLWSGTQQVIPAGWYLVPKKPTVRDLVPCAVACYTALVHDVTIFTDGFWPCLEKDIYGKHACIRTTDQGLYLTWDPKIQMLG